MHLLTSQILLCLLLFCKSSQASSTIHFESNCNYDETVNGVQQVDLYKSEMKSSVSTLTIDVNSSLNLFYDRVRLKWNELAEPGMDDYDAIKFNGGNYYAPRLALIVDSLPWSINAMPAPKSPIIIPLEIKSNLSGTFTVDFDPEAAFVNETLMEVVNTETNERYPLEPGLSVSIDITQGEPNRSLVLEIVNTLSYNQTNVSCFAGNNGQAQVSTPGNAEAWNFIWEDVDGNLLLEETVLNGISTLDNLNAGTYTATLTHPNWPAKFKQFELSEPLPLQVNINSEDESCFGQQDGAIHAHVSGGTAPYGILLDGVHFLTPSISNLAPGEYMVTAIDDHNCTTSPVNTEIKPGDQLMFYIESNTTLVNLNNNAPVNFNYVGQAADKISWDFGDGGIGTGETVNHQYSEVGTYEVVCTAEKDNCETMHEPITILVVNEPTSLNEPSHEISVNTYFTGDALMIDFNEEAFTGKISITQSNGQEVFATHLTTGKHIRIPLKLSAGIYLVHGQSTHQQFTKRIIAW